MMSTDVLWYDYMPVTVRIGVITTSRGDMARITYMLLCGLVRWDEIGFNLIQFWCP